MSAGQMTVSLDRTAGTMTLVRGKWSLEAPIGDLPKWRHLYRCLWSRRKDKPFRDHGTPGTWARFYEDSVRALDAAAKEAGL